MNRFERSSDVEKDSGRRELKLTMSADGLPAIEIKNPTSKEREILLQLLGASDIRDSDYILRTRVSAYLQRDRDDLLHVEFWKGSPADHRAFMDRLQEMLDEV